MSYSERIRWSSSGPLRSFVFSIPLAELCLLILHLLVVPRYPFQLLLHPTQLVLYFCMSRLDALIFPIQISDCFLGAVEILCRSIAPMIDQTVLFCKAIIPPCSLLISGSNSSRSCTRSISDVEAASSLPLSSFRSWISQKVDS